MLWVLSAIIYACISFLPSYTRQCLLWYIYIYSVYLCIFVMTFSIVIYKKYIHIKATKKYSPTTSDWENPRYNCSCVCIYIYIYNVYTHTLVVYDVFHIAHRSWKCRIETCPCNLLSFSFYYFLLFPLSILFFFLLYFYFAYYELHVCFVIYIPSFSKGKSLCRIIATRARIR